MNSKIKQMLCSMILLAAMLMVLFSVQTVFASENSGEDGEKTVIGVSVYNINDSEVQTFRRYFENYIGLSFDVDFLYSSSISTSDEEAEFIQKLHDRGVKGVISFVSSYAETTVPLCDSLGMYYVSGSGTLSAELFEKLKDYPTFLGTIGPNAEEEKNVGVWLADQYIEKDTEKNFNYLVYTGGSSFGNEMHRLRAVGMLEELDKFYGLPSEKSCEEWAEITEQTSITTESGTMIYLYPGYSDEVPASKEVFQKNPCDKVLSVAMFNKLMDVVEEMESVRKTDIQVGLVGCFTEDAKDWFNLHDDFGNSKINYLVGKYGATVAPSFVAMFNAYTGYAEQFRDNGETFELYQPFWYASNPKEFNEQYESSEGIVENTYSAVEILDNLAIHNEKADFEQFRQFTER